MSWLQEIGARRCGSKTRLRITLLVLLLPVPVSWCRIVGVLSVARLTQSADYIFTGDVVDVHQVGESTLEDGGHTYPVTRMVAEVRVGEVLKGAISDRVIQVQFIQYQSVDNSGPLTDRLTAPSYRLLFLNRASKDFVFANREHGSLPVSRDVADVPRMTDSETYSKVVAYLARGIFSTEGSSQERLSSLFVLTMEPPSTYLDEIFRAALKSQAAESDADLRMQLMAIMIRRHDEAVLPELEKELVTSQEGEHINARVNMILSLQFIDGAKAVPILAQALFLPDAELRRYAAIALQSTKSAAAIDPLLEALHDENRWVQFAVMQSLGFLNHELEWRPRAEDPGSNWDACLQHWDEFAKSREASNPQ